MEFYFDNRFLTYGHYGMPLVRKQPVDLSGLKLMRFSDARKDETQDQDATIHFFIDDSRFDEIWKDPQGYVAELSQYKQVLSPQFSVFVNFSRVLQIFNTFRSRWMGAYFQSKGMTVIPTITWGNETSFDFVYDAIEKGSVLAVSTLGNSSNEWMFMKGFREMCERLEPDAVICYSRPFKGMFECADIIAVPYTKTARVSEALPEARRR
jgi:hypothetical protein